MDISATCSIEEVDGWERLKGLGDHVADVVLVIDHWSRRRGYRWVLKTEKAEAMVILIPATRLSHSKRAHSESKGYNRVEELIPCTEVRK